MARASGCRRKPSGNTPAEPGQRVGAIHYTFGDADGELGDHAWFSGNSGGVTHPVGQKRRNRFGLFDMHGNVLEWCQDSYDENYYKQSQADDPRVSFPRGPRVHRGGSWDDDPYICQSAARGHSVPARRSDNIGFRLALNQPGR